MTGKKQMLNNRMKLLWDSYVKEIPHKIRAISVSWQTILDMRHGDYSANLRDLIRGLHTIGGTASTFGHVKLGIAAHRAERELKLIQETGELSASTEKQFALCLVEMNNIIAALSVDENLDSCLDVGQYEVRTRKNVTNRTIVLVDDDEWFSSNLALQLNCFGYEVITFNRLQDMEEALPTLDAACFIMDLSFPEGIAAGAETVRRLWAVKNYAIPVVFLSKRNDTISRLEAVKAGSDAYFLKPVRIIELIDKLDQLTSQSEPPPYKVLVVDDEQVVAEYHALLLEQNGIQARILTNPLQVLDAISDFNPDLILMDLNMPKCNGYELSKVIRQVPAYFRIPIVFLSQETDPELQMQAMNTGGDDFLTKPVNPEYFLSSVRVRAERMRILRTLMERDGLSGLYNHSVMKEQIESVFI